MNPSPTLFLLLLVSAFSSLASSSGNQPLLVLPRPLIAERLAEGGGGGIGGIGGIGGVGGVGVDVDSDDVRLRCASWRFAGEANNLAPWRTVPQECGDYVREYMTGKAYVFDLEIAAREAADFARSMALAGDGKDAWVFDVDETLLSNLPYYANHGFGLELFNGQEFDKWVDKAVAPAINSSLKLYKEVLDLGFKIFVLTGRIEEQRAVTTDNLNNVGFQDWEKLILRGAGDQNKSAILYKSEKRSEIVADGYRIHGNSGDQWSDLMGSNASNRSFKLPNPMYYIA